MTDTKGPRGATHQRGRNRVPCKSQSFSLLIIGFTEKLTVAC